MALLEVLNLHREERNRPLLQSISFSLDAGDRLAIIGVTGSGKTTLLKIIAGLQPASGGTVLMNGERVAPPNERLLPGHPHIAYLSQHFELRNQYRVSDLLSIDNPLDAEEAARLYRICSIDHLLQRKTHELSGGERQRIALAQALSRRPQLLLLDEPFSNADLQHKAVLKTVLLEVNQQLRTAMILVTHDPGDALPWADQLMVLEAGRVVQSGHPATVYHHPKSEYVAAITGLYNLLSPSLAQDIGFSAPGGTHLTIIRPEQLRIQRGEGNVIAIIEKVEFLGPHYLAHVNARGIPLKVLTSFGGYRKGEQVALTTI